MGRSKLSRKAWTLSSRVSRQNWAMLPITATGYPSTVQRFVLRVLATAAGVLLANYLLHNLIKINSDSPIIAAIVFALILGVLNAFLRPVLLLLALPLNLLTLGLFTLVVNAIVFWLATVLQGGDIQVADFGAALLGSLIVSVVSFVASRALT
jgi:putative membrane protein